jgi:putative transposase
VRVARLDHRVAVAVREEHRELDCGDSLEQRVVRDAPRADGVLLRLAGLPRRRLVAVGRPSSEDAPGRLPAGLATGLGAGEEDGEVALEESILAADFFRVDTVFLRRLYVLVFLSIGSRRIEYVACTRSPNTRWMQQQARNLLMELDDREQQVRFLLHDRDARFPRAFDALLATEGIKVIRTPVRAPNANAHVERWVGSVRRECLDRLMIAGRRQLEHVLRVYIRHYNRRRPHRALDLRPPDRSARSSLRGESTLQAVQVSRRDLLGGLIHEYDIAAAA